MSNSNLVTYTKLSPNCTKPRNHKIDTITIHVFVGQVTAKQGCNTSKFVKYDPVRGASCNYVVGRDGSIGLCVDEANRSWCSSSGANDHRAVTIEVASDSRPPYAVTSEAYAALIELVADICKRNDIEKLVWSTEKNNRVNHLNGCNMTVHRDYANKDCPGEYLYNRHGDIAAKVNSVLGVEPDKNEAVHATYRAYAGKWWGEIVDCNDVDSNGYAGVQGRNMTGLMVKPSKGKVQYRVHLLGGGWLPWVNGYNTKDSNNGYAGILGKKIDAVQMRLTGADEYEVQYRVSPANSKTWYGWCTGLTNAAGDGYAGVLGKAIDCVQVKIVKK